jgi:hypothetical protein
MRSVLLAVCAALVAGCASYDGRGLVPGGSTGAQVEALMGKPSERVSKPDGSSVLYYSRNPVGRHAYAVTLGPDGVMRGIEQRLTLANINKLMAGKTTSAEARELFGPPDPYSVGYLPLMQRDVWEYKWLEYDDRRVLWLHFSKDGILREVINAHDFAADEPSGGPGLP